MAEQSQSFENHAKIVPGYHYVLTLLLLVNLVWRLYGVVTGPSLETGVSFLTAFALLMIAFFARAFALGVQDRVIHLEERMRLGRLAPDLAPRLHTLTTNQIVALRFASDDELPALARKVLDEALDDRKAIKQMVRAWRPDHLRI